MTEDVDVMTHTSRVSLTHTDDPGLADGDVLGLVRGALRPLGGMEAFVAPGDTVLLKPNQTLFFLATDGVTTDPRVVAALVTLAREAGAARVVVGDGSGGDTRSSRVMQVTGIERLARQAGADEVVGLEETPQREVAVGVGGRRFRLPVSTVVLDADVVVNVPKAKTHFEDPLTLSIKNWVGIIHPEARPRIMDDALLFDAVAALYRAVPSDLSVVDGLWAGEGEGPAANTPVWLGCVVAGRDPVAVDHVVARLMGVEDLPMRFLDAAEAAGVGQRGPVEVIGPSIEAVRIRARPSRPGFAHLPIRVLEGDGVTWAGSLGHLKSLAEAFHRFGVWSAVESVYGPPTFMVGRIEDPDFEAAVSQGPYFVIDDVASPRYKDDPRATFIPGHPATHSLFSGIFRRLHVENVGPQALRLAEVWKQVEAFFHQPKWRVGAGERTGQVRR